MFCFDVKSETVKLIWFFKNEKVQAASLVLET